MGPFPPEDLEELTDGELPVKEDDKLATTDDDEELFLVLVMLPPIEFIFPVGVVSLLREMPPVLEEEVGVTALSVNDFGGLPGEGGTAGL